MTDWKFRLVERVESEFREHRTQNTHDTRVTRVKIQNPTKVLALHNLSLPRDLAIQLLGRERAVLLRFNFVDEIWHNWNWVGLGISRRQTTDNENHRSEEKGHCRDHEWPRRSPFASSWFSCWRVILLPLELLGHWERHEEEGHWRRRRRHCPSESSQRRGGVAGKVRTDLSWIPSHSRAPRNLWGCERSYLERSARWHSTSRSLCISTARQRPRRHKCWHWSISRRFCTRYFGRCRFTPSDDQGSCTEASYFISSCE